MPDVRPVPLTNQEPKKRHPSIFWWSLINVIALAFAIFSWTGCYFLFNFPERPWNYSVLQKINRLPELTFFEKQDLPKGKAIPPGLIYQRYDDVTLRRTNPNKSPGETLATLNAQLKRNYISHYKSPVSHHYIAGNWRIRSVRKLDDKDFISSGFALLAQALVIPNAQMDSTSPELLPYPVELEILLPTSSETEIPPQTEIAEDNSFTLNKHPHALAVLHVSRSGTPDEPVTRVTAIPLSQTAFPLTKDTVLPLLPPTQVNPEGQFPLFK